MPLLLLGAIPETNEVEINLWGGDAPALILGNDYHLAHTGKEGVCTRWSIGPKSAVLGRRPS